jgi:HlyD family secretion protein
MPIRANVSAVVERIDLASRSPPLGSESSASGSVVSYEARPVANVNGLLRPGMTATATISTENTAAIAGAYQRTRFNLMIPAVKKAAVCSNPQIGLGARKQQATIMRVAAGSRFMS